MSILSEKDLKRFKDIPGFNNYKIDLRGILFSKKTKRFFYKKNQKSNKSFLYDKRIALVGDDKKVKRVLIIDLVYLTFGYDKTCKEIERIRKLDLKISKQLGEI